MIFQCSVLLGPEKRDNKHVRQMGGMLDFWGNKLGLSERKLPPLTEPDPGGAMTVGSWDWQCTCPAVKDGTG